jgi:hypothetical protein
MDSRDKARFGPSILNNGIIYGIILNNFKEM